MSTDQRIQQFRQRLVEVINAAEMPASVVLLVLENLELQLRHTLQAQEAAPKDGQAGGEG